MTKSRTLATAFGAGVLILLAGCSASDTDFKAAAEKAIKGSDGLGEGSTAECEKPAGTDVGTTFACTGTDADGNAYEFTATISAKDKVTVTGGAAAPADGTTDTTGS